MIEFSSVISSVVRTSTVGFAKLAQLAVMDHATLVLKELVFALLAYLATMASNVSVNVLLLVPNAILSRTTSEATVSVIIFLLDRIAPPDALLSVSTATMVFHALVFAINATVTIGVLIAPLARTPISQDVPLAFVTTARVVAIHL